MPRRDRGRRGSRTLGCLGRRGSRKHRPHESHPKARVAAVIGTVVVPPAVQQRGCRGTPPLGLPVALARLLCRCGPSGTSAVGSQFSSARVRRGAFSRQT